MTEVTVSDAAKAAAENAKAEGYEPLYTKIAGKEFVYRALERAEWRALVKARNQSMEAAKTDLEKAEVAEQELEEILKVCLVYSSQPIEKLPAGSIQAVCEMIMADSGFAGPEIQTIKL